MFRLLKALPLTLALAALSFFAASCGSGSQSQIRVVNAIPDVPNNTPLDIDVNGTKVITALAFPNFQPSSGYTKVASGSVTIAALDTGTTTQVLSSTGTLSGSTQYTVVLPQWDHPGGCLYRPTWHGHHQCDTSSGGGEPPCVHAGERVRFRCLCSQRLCCDRYSEREQSTDREPELHSANWIHSYPGARRQRGRWKWNVDASGGVVGPQLIAGSRFASRKHLAINFHAEQPGPRPRPEPSNRLEPSPGGANQLSPAPSIQSPGRTTQFSPTSGHRKPTSQQPPKPHL